MIIPINKDFEQDYPDEVLAGFTLPQIVSVALIIMVSGCIVYVLSAIVGIPADIAVYFAIPAVLVLGAFGFYRHQGMSCLGWLKAVRRNNSHRMLLWEADENIYENDSYWCDRKEIKQELKRQRQIMKKRKKRRRGGRGHGAA